MPFSKNQLFVQFHSVDLCIEYRVLFFEENWIFKVKAVYADVASRTVKYPVEIIFGNSLV